MSGSIHQNCIATLVKPLILLEPGLKERDEGHPRGQGRLGLRRGGQGERCVPRRYAEQRRVHGDLPLDPATLHGKRHRRPRGHPGRQRARAPDHGGRQGRLATLGGDKPQHNGRWLLRERGAAGRDQRAQGGRGKAPPHGAPQRPRHPRNDHSPLRAARAGPPPWPG